MSNREGTGQKALGGGIRRRRKEEGSHVARLSKRPYGD